MRHWTKCPCLAQISSRWWKQGEIVEGQEPQLFYGSKFSCSYFCIMHAWRLLCRAIQEGPLWAMPTDLSFPPAFPFCTSGCLTPHLIQALPKITVRAGHKGKMESIWIFGNMAVSGMSLRCWSQPLKPPNEGWKLMLERMTPSTVQEDEKTKMGTKIGVGCRVHAQFV